jgi:lysophospholipase L1-like esterase
MVSFTRLVFVCMIQLNRFYHLVLLGLCFSLFSIACRKQSAFPSTGNAPANRYLALGDSYTIGQGVEDAMRFPSQTVRKLRSQGFRLDDPTYVAYTGWTTQRLVEAIERAGLTERYDLVSLLIGVNDQFTGLDTGLYARQFETCLLKAIQYSGNRKERVFVLSIPDYSVTPVGRVRDSLRVSKEIDLFNLVNRRIAMTHGISYLDITQSSRQASFDPRLVTTDGLHPSGLEYSRWVDSLAPLMQKVLE